VLIPEDVKRAPRRRLFALMGVPWEATRRAWISPFLAAGLGLAAAFAARSPDPVGPRILTGIGYGVSLYSAVILHAVGHIISGRAVGSPMAANIVTATFHLNEYAEPAEPLPPHIHIGRALGGPMANLIVGLAAIGLSSILGSHWLASFSAANLAFGALALLPIPTIDGEVIWRELLRRKRT
jgi:Zn-dependent protease